MMSDENRQTMHCLSKDTLIDMIHDLGTKLEQAHRAGWEQGKREALKQCKAIANTCDMESSYSRGCFSTADQLEFDIAAMEYKDSDLCK